jgi:hypothetical protein
MDLLVGPIEAAVQAVDEPVGDPVDEPVGAGAPSAASTEPGERGSPDEPLWRGDG